MMAVSAMTRHSPPPVRATRSGRKQGVGLGQPARRAERVGSSTPALRNSHKQQLRCNICNWHGIAPPNWPSEPTLPRRSATPGEIPAGGRLSSSFVAMSCLAVDRTDSPNLTEIAKLWPRRETFLAPGHTEAGSAEVCKRPNAARRGIVPEYVRRLSFSFHNSFSS